MPEHFYPTALFVGLLTMCNTLVFCSLAWEVARAQEKTTEWKDEEAYRIARATLHWCGVVMLLAVAAEGVSCLLLDPADEGWRTYFAAAVFACGAHFAYTRTTERRLRAFIQAAGARALRAPAPRPPLPRLPDPKENRCAPGGVHSDE